MKKLLISISSATFIVPLVILFILINCAPTQTDEQKLTANYSIRVKRFIPDSNKVKFKSYIVDVMKSTHNNLSAGDYEDIDDVLEMVTHAAEVLYSNEEYVLGYNVSRYNLKTIRQKSFTEEQKIIFDKLMARRRR